MDTNKAISLPRSTVKSMIKKQKVSGTSMTLPRSGCPSKLKGRARRKFITLPRLPRCIWQIWKELQEIMAKSGHCVHVWIIKAKFGSSKCWYRGIHLSNCVIYLFISCLNCCYHIFHLKVIHAAAKLFSYQATKQQNGTHRTMLYIVSGIVAFFLPFIPPWSWFVLIMFAYKTSVFYAFLYIFFLGLSVLEALSFSKSWLWSPYIQVNVSIYCLKLSSFIKSVFCLDPYDHCMRLYFADIIYKIGKFYQHSSVFSCYWMCCTDMSCNHWASMRCQSVLTPSPRPSQGAFSVWITAWDFCQPLCYW